MTRVAAEEPQPGRRPVGRAADVPIEERSPRELTHISGLTAAGKIETIRVIPEGSPALNLGFDVTPARLVTGLITERGVCAANREALRQACYDGASTHA